MTPRASPVSGYSMLSEKEFNDLALLARLDPKDKSLAGLRDDFNRILDFVNQIQEIDTSAVREGHAPNDTVNVTREDLPVDPPGADVISGFAPQWEAGHFVVPGVLDQEH